MSTIVMIHRKENLKKCSVWPLHTRDDFRFHVFPFDIPKLDPRNTIRLGLGGAPLSSADRDKDLLVLDATWRLAAQMEEPFVDIPLRSIPAYKTAYPRIACGDSDPSQGLATIEAIFCAYRLLGHSTEGLLEHYYWKEAFLNMNHFG